MMENENSAGEPNLGKHERTSNFFLSSFEKAILPKLAASIPKSIKPDHLTILGLLAATCVGISYVLSKSDELWLLITNFFIIVNWFGDSLDGTLARVRKAERPRYGFYLDHITDTYSTLVIGLGLGLSPYMTLAIGLSIVIAYFLLSINVYIETHVFKEFQSSYGRFGPTEIRFMLILLNTAAYIHGIIPFKIFDINVTLFDLIGFGGVFSMLGLLIQRAASNLRRLAALEPPRA
jgi:archaetidylinositol phosphate synthase